MRSMWKGAISFGLVMIPVRLYAATEQKDIAFRQVHRSDGGRIRFRRVCSVCGEEVPYEDVAKGYELPTGEMVVLTDEDMADLPLPTTRSIEVVHFMPAEQLDPILLNRSYFVEPESAGARAYVLLRDSLDRSGKVALTMVALRQRESLATLRTRNGVLVLETLLWPDEIRVPDFPFLTEDIEVRSQELKMAASLIDSMTEDFDPDAYHDSYREALQEVVDAKVEGREVVQPEGVSAATEPTSLADALKASLAAARRAPSRAGEIGEEVGAPAAAGEDKTVGAPAAAGEDKTVRAPAAAGEIKTAKAPRRAIGDGAKTRATAAGGARAGGGKDGTAGDGAGAASARTGRSKAGAAPGGEAEDTASHDGPGKSPRRPPGKEPAKEAETSSTSAPPRGRRRAS